MKMVSANRDRQPRQPKYQLKPISLPEALTRIQARRNDADVCLSPWPMEPFLAVMQAARFAIQVVDAEDNPIALALCGQSLIPQLDNGYTLEILAGWSMNADKAKALLFLAAWRTGLAMGYRRMLGYFRKEESCVPLVAASLMRLHGQFGVRMNCVGEAELAWGRGEWDLPAPGQFSIN
ncbi:hypothetical protein [Tuwongella immobilis]|nr:hypothetical protein [Tuwongella immobilis]